MNKYRNSIEKILSLIEEKISLEAYPEKLFFLQEKYRCALHEIEKTGEIKTNLIGGVRVYLDSYSDYINNELLNEMDKLEQSLKKSYRSEICSSRESFTIFQKGVLNGAKTPHSTSQPVIYQENGKYYLAVFVFFFDREDIEAGTVNRPTVWALADIATGEIIEERETKDIDFSDASYDVKYNIREDGKYDTSKKYYDEAFAILDSVRSKIINTGKFYRAEYQFYLDKIIANIPKEYQRFYTDLSV